LIEGRWQEANAEYQILVKKSPAIAKGGRKEQGGKIPYENEYQEI